MKTFSAKREETEQKWWLVDANDKTLGNIAVEVAKLLRGKHKPVFTPNVDTGDFVVVVNAEKFRLTGKKWEQKKYYRHSRYFGSTKEFTAKEMVQKDPEFMIEDAVKGMLPKNILSKQLITKLKTYRGASHPHAAQKPQSLNIK